MTGPIQLPDYHIRFKVVKIRRPWAWPVNRRKILVEAEWKWWDGDYQSGGEHWIDEGDTLTMVFPLELSGEAVRTDGEPSNRV